MENKINFCKPATMSECSAVNPEKCKHYKSSKMHSRCLFQSLKLADCYHCGCSEAQSEARNIEVELIEEIKESDMPT